MIDNASAGNNKIKDNVATNTTTVCKYKKMMTANETFREI